MKKALPLLLFLFCVVNTAQAQFFARLRITQFINFPDTAYEGVAYPIQFVLKNVGTAPFQGPVQIVLQTDSAFDVLYFSNNPNFVLFPNDIDTLSVNVLGSSGYIFTSQVFRPGNDVVVVWPYSTQSGVQYDSTYSALHFIPVSGITGTETGELVPVNVYPNPFSDFIHLETPPDIIPDRVRIIDLSGREVYVSAIGTKTIPTSALDAGIYILEISAANKKAILKIVKL